MSKTITLYILIFCVFTLTTNVALAADCSLADTVIKITSSLRELPVKKNVKCKEKTKEEIRKALIDTIEREIPAEKVESEERVGKFLGFLPFHYDYLNELIALYTSEIAGFYDPKKNYFAMANWIQENMQMPVLVHELTHALQDQYFNLDDFIDPKKQTTDEQMARSALIEGDAMVITLNYQMSLAGRGMSIDAMPQIDSFIIASVIGSAVSFSGRDVPFVIKSTMIFPYVSGLRFVHALRRKGGVKLVNKVFKNPPSTTAEILNPDQYLSKTLTFKPVKSAEIIKLCSKKGGKAVSEDVLGQFLLSIFLKQHGLDESLSMAWQGDRVAICESSDGKKQDLVWKINWKKSKAKDAHRVLVQGFEKLKEKMKDSNWKFSSLSLDFSSIIEIHVENVQIYGKKILSL